MTQPSDGDVDASMEAAAAVHRAGALRPPAARVALLRGAAAELEQRAAELIAAGRAEAEQRHQNNEYDNFHLSWHRGHLRAGIRIVLG